MPDTQLQTADEKSQATYPIVKARVKCSRCHEVYVVRDSESVRQAQDRHRREECRGSA